MSGYKRHFTDEELLEMIDSHTPDDTDYDYVPDSETPVDAAFEKPLHHKLNGWDGHSRKGQAVYDAIFEQEKAQALKQDCRDNICTCCEGSPYFGMQCGPYV